MRLTSVTVDTPGPASRDRVGRGPDWLRHTGRGRRKRDVERCTGIDLADGPCATTVTLNDSPYVGQTDPGSREFMRAMKSLKHAVQLVAVLHVEANAVVPYIDHDVISHCGL